MRCQETGLCQKKHQQLINNEVEELFRGITGVTCLETLAFFEPHKSLVRLTESCLVKTATHVCAITNSLTGFDVKGINTHIRSKLI